MNVLPTGNKTDQLNCNCEDDCVIITWLKQFSVNRSQRTCSYAAIPQRSSVFF